MEGIELAKQLKSVDVYEQVAKLVNQKTQTMPVRLAALRAINVIDSPRSTANPRDLARMALAQKLVSRHNQKARIHLVEQQVRDDRHSRLLAFLDACESPFDYDIENAI